jgi:hypothetical protein
MRSLAQSFAGSRQESDGGESDQPWARRFEKPEKRAIPLTILKT